MKVFIILVALLAVITSWVIRQWDADENWAFNIFIIILPRLLDPPVETFFGKSKAQQMALIQSMRDKGEMMLGSERALRFAMGDRVADASYGLNATRVAKLKIIPVADDRRHVDVTCTCPDEATTDDALPLIFFFHSGGLIFGSVNSELPMARYLSQKVGAVVCSPEYRLAPEHPYPAGLDDCVDSSLAVLSDDAQRKHVADALGIRDIVTNRVVTFGMSAGGYLSALVARELTAAGHALALQVMLVPMAQPHGGGTTSMFEHWNAPLWNGPLNMWAWSMYIPGDADGTLARHHRVNLLVDPPGEDSIRRLPPAYVQINTKDVLRDEGERYAIRLREAGRLLRLDEFNTNHVGGVLTGIFSKGGPGENAIEDAVNVVRFCMLNTC